MATPAKKFAWSFSKLKNFETCPKRHYEIDIAKNVVEAPSEQLAYGNRVHKSLADAIGKAIPLPPDLLYLQRWVDRVLKWEGVRHVEQRYAITREFAPCSWFAPNAWYRGIGDLVVIDTQLGIIDDWKTGRVLEDSVQLALMAQCLFSHFPELTHVHSEYVWTAHDCKTAEVFTRPDMVNMWPALLQRVDAMEQAAVGLSYPPKPGGLCVRYCPVVSCPYHGKGSNR